jgi:hypothetical protein
MARLTWTSDLGIGESGGYSCNELDYLIERKDASGRYFAPSDCRISKSFALGQPYQAIKV